MPLVGICYVQVTMVLIIHNVGGVDKARGKVNESNITGK